MQVRGGLANGGGGEADFSAALLTMMLSAASVEMTVSRLLNGSPSDPTHRNMRDEWGTRGFVAGAGEQSRQQPQRIIVVDTDQQNNGRGRYGQSTAMAGRV
jgi:hypothetical protein